MKSPGGSYEKVQDSQTGVSSGCDPDGWYEVNLAQFVGGAANGKWELDFYWHGDYVAGSQNTFVTMTGVEFLH